MNSNFYHTKNSVDEYIHMAKDVNGVQLIESLKDFLVPNSSVLELGSGPKTDWKILKEHFKVIGSDYSTEFLDRLKSKNPDGEFLNLNACSLLTEKTFDAIYSNKVLHHLTDEELSGSILRQKEILKPEGFVCHSFWYGEGTEIYNGIFVYYQNETSLSSCFGKYFDILILDNYKEFEDGVHYYSSEERNQMQNKFGFLHKSKPSVNIKYKLLMVH